MPKQAALSIGTIVSCRSEAPKIYYFGLAGARQRSGPNQADCLLLGKAQSCSLREGEEKKREGKREGGRKSGGGKG